MTMRGLFHNLFFIQFRYLKKDKLIHPPPLMEGEAIASRILELGPAGAKFLGPVIIEVPHFASLRGKEREIVILRSDNGENWKEHTLEATEEAVQEVLQDSFDEGGELAFFCRCGAATKTMQKSQNSFQLSLQ